MTQPNSIGPAGLQLIQNYEGLRLAAYLCPAGKLTIGYGHVVQPREYAFFGVEKERLADIVRSNQTAGKVVIPLNITVSQATELLRIDTRQTALFLASVTRPPLNQYQFDALGSFIFNVGQGNYATSTLRKKIDASDFNAAAEQFGKWIYATVKGQKTVLNGLVKRRAEERELFLRKAPITAL